MCAGLSTIAAPVCRLERQVSFLQVGNTREALIGTIDRAIVGETPASWTGFKKFYSDGA